jgi:hypothetical protein
VNIERLHTPWWALRAGIGAAAFLAGLDKLFNLTQLGGYVARDQIGARSLGDRRNRVTA